MVNDSFSFMTNPKLIFGAGSFQKLPELIGGIGANVLIVTGSGSLKARGKWDELVAGLTKAGINYYEYQVQGKPSVGTIDIAVSEYRAENVHAVVAIGGGSVMDTGKAVSAMLPYNDSVEVFLEGVGTKKHDGTKAPFIAVPTTAGTGSEATKNAVISKIGPKGYKKSLRHDNFIPDIALIDPELALTCPAEVTIASGLDAVTQLMESYVSPKASGITDALAFSGLEAAAASFPSAVENGLNDLDARRGMAYAAYLSGVAITNAGVGTVHGFASAIGGLFEVPHGVICGIFLAAVTRATIESLKKTGDVKTLEKYAGIGGLFAGKEFVGADKGCESLLAKLDEWTEKYELPKLGEFGIHPSDMERILDQTDNKNNPALLKREELEKVLKNRI